MAHMPTLHPLRELTVAATTHPRGQAHLSSASGLVCEHGRVYVIADDEQHLGVFDDIRSPGRLMRLLDGELPAAKKARKRVKADFEVLVALPASTAWPHAALLALGSGSRPNRERGVVVALDAGGHPHGPARTIDLAPLYAPLHQRFDELNIEGALLLGDDFVLLQRGHQGAAVNAALHFRYRDVVELVEGRAASPLQPVAEHRFALGEVDGVPLCFTDGAALPDGRWLFTAVAEATDDSYADGPCAASAVGLVGADGTLQALRGLTPPHKVEGIAARLHGGTLDLCLVSDADDPAMPSQLFSARW
jgi:hypothetical protein